LGRLVLWICLRGLLIGCSEAFFDDGDAFCNNFVLIEESFDRILEIMLRLFERLRSFIKKLEKLFYIFCQIVNFHGEMGQHVLKIYEIF